MNCDYCKKESWKEMCDCCAEADEAGILNEYLAGSVECPACVREGESDDVETVSWSNSNPTGEIGESK